MAGLQDRIAEALQARRELGGLITELGALQIDRAERGRIAADAVETIVTDGLLDDPRRWREIDALLSLADGAVPMTDSWARTRTVAAVTSLMGSLIDGRSVDIGDVSARLETLSAQNPTDAVLQLYLSTARSMLGLVGSVRSGDPATIPSVLDDLQGWTTALGDDSSRPGAGTTSDAFSMMRLLNGGHRLSDEDLAHEVAQADDDDRVVEAAMRHMTVSAAALRGGEETDTRRIDIGVDHARKAVEQTGSGDARRVLYLTGLALALLRRFEIDPSTTSDLHSARDHLEQARSLAGGPGHPQWQMIGEMLTEVRRHLGDRTDVAGPAVEGLREHVWRVLAQNDFGDVRAAARTASTDAVDVARTCLAAGDPARAVAALDAGRGLALFAATATRTVGALLEGAGHADLAGQWDSAAARGTAALPASLRREVLAVLAETEGGALLDPPALDQIGRALQQVDADALTYLVPGGVGIPGYAVVVSAAGRAGFLALPNLAVEHYPEIEDFLATAARRDATGLAAESLTDEFGGVLDRLCTWAWGAAMGPLIDVYLSGLPEPPPRRPRRVVLIPMGDLARVPWHAARNGQGRHAIEFVAVSQTASARMLCRSSELSKVSSTAGGLVVGDPGIGGSEGSLPDLVHARIEALAIRESFYRGARYLGRRPNGTTSPSGSGTVEEVERWVTSRDPSDGVMAHFACHAVVRATGADPTAHLVLANGERWSAGELIDLLLRQTERAIGLVVLSACRTGGSPTGHDEAYSLGTALLAGGVRSVLCTQWNSSDLLHPALMYMVHHFHRNEAMPAWEALRRAQLWALDERRTVPDAMPDRLHPAARSRALGHVVVWASVGHWGQ